MRMREKPLTEMVYIKAKNSRSDFRIWKQQLSQGDILIYYQFIDFSAKDSKLAKSSLVKFLSLSLKREAGIALVYATYLGNRDDGNILYMIALCSGVYHIDFALKLLYRL